MLEAYRTYLKSRQAYQNEQFSYNDMIHEEGGIRWQEVRAKKILFCEGTYNGVNPYFNWLPVEQVKGELLLVHIPGMPAEEIINRGVFVLPVGNGYFKVGSTYQWDHPDWQPSLQGKQELEEKLQKLIKLPFQITDHKAGIRPACPDRRPLIGLHPEHQTVGVFNGLGTKGISIAPYYASHFVDYLEDNKELNPEVHINRYFSLYYKSKF
jgi:glycine/D-amino acid oxidase-like deaminating enzyme